MSITREDILQIATLAKLSVDESELEKLTKDMSEMISFADTISAVSTEASDFDNINGLINVMREDVVEESFDRDEILRNAENQDEGYFLVKKRS
ncbi:MAG: Asp-tRNA(Asn)/Glu-tRNA(Gln) amidotransferase subunit GatC [Clostridiales bacterium]|jgi:aspartyl-tRNA(Asn)/glutamyl-tRNA(Gln) amidotransferase subunit C|nr:Asp-tRNA(Asn)/Glu-tRNA(Gln) amidotransferase subunit GatC [Clostridiales bacterium]